MYLAIDIGGSKTLLATFSGEGRVLESIKFKTPQEYPEFLKELETAFKSLPQTGKLTRAVAGAPGLVDRSKGIVRAYGNLDWIDTPLQNDLEKITGIPVRIENDANLAGLSEARLIHNSYRKILYITISTGIGGVIIKDGKIDADYPDIEFGHMVFEHEGKIQQWEDFASGHALFEKHGKKASEIEDPAIWYELSHNIALGLTNVIVNLTPDVIIVGGGVGAHFEKFSDKLHEQMLLYSSKLVAVPVPTLRKALRAEEAVIHGCYELARQTKD